MKEILKEIKAERQRQIDKFGDQSHLPDFAKPLFWRDEPILANAWSGRQACEESFARGEGSYLAIFAEEVCEAGHEARWGTPEALREELIQVAAVCVAWIEKLDK